MIWGKKIKIGFKYNIIYNIMSKNVRVFGVSGNSILKLIFNYLLLFLFLSTYKKIWLIFCLYLYLIWMPNNRTQLFSRLIFANILI